MELKQLTIRASLALSVLVVVVVALSSLPQVESRPSITDGWVQYNNRFGIPNERRSDQIADVTQEVRELCQRCAKVTKSKLAYPMCCENREDARVWCRDLLAFG